MMPPQPEHVPAGTTWTAAAGGDDEALTALVRAYHARVYRFGRRVCRDSFDADDAVQEAFIALGRRHDVVDHAGALSWLMTVVRNACRRMLRPFGRQRHALGSELSNASAAEELPTDALDPQEALERWEVVYAVHGALAALPRPYREILVLRELEGLTGPETCAALGLDRAAMKSRLHRARASLRAMLVRPSDDHRVGGRPAGGRYQPGTQVPPDAT